jgi:hypothetical protein
MASRLKHFDPSFLRSGFAGKPKRRLQRTSDLDAPRYRAHGCGKPSKAKERTMEFGIFNLMGSRDPAKPTVQVFAEVSEQTRLADELGYAIAWFAEHHFSNYCPARRR